MRARGDHKLGQYRAELFEEIVFTLLRALYPRAEIERYYFVRIRRKAKEETALSVDFILREGGHAHLIESRAPYLTTSTPGIKRTLRDLRKQSVTDGFLHSFCIDKRLA